MIRNFAGAFPLGDGGPATSALLYYPAASIADGAGNLFILDTNNSRIRKVTPDGKISTFSDVFGYDMKLAPDGSLIVASFARIYRVSASGVATVVAGTGSYGYSGDNGQATAAQIGMVYGVGLGSNGSIYFTESSSAGYHLRQISSAGAITTIAGIPGYGFNGDNQPAISATLYSPRGIAIDSNGAVYVADQYNSRIRKIQPSGVITTVAGNGSYGQPLDGPAIASPLPSPSGLYIDGSNNLFITEMSFGVVLKMSPAGVLTRVAGSYAGYGSVGDGPALGVSLLSPNSVSVDTAGNLYVTDAQHLVRKITPAGNAVTVAGRVHYAGDDGPAVSAILNQPAALALDQGSLLIADSSNYVIRRVSSDGKITSYAGKLMPGTPADGSSIANARLPYITAMTSDGKGSIYFTTYWQAFKITPNGIISVLAGTGNYGSGGDGGKATAATFQQLSGIALDLAGNVYLADASANRIRKVGADGIISNYAGSGTVTTLAGGGGLATSAQFGAGGGLAIDSQGNLYIGDTRNYRVHMVDSSGIFTTVVGNGTYGRPSDGARAASAAFSQPSSIAVDSAGSLFVGSSNNGDIFKISGGIIRRLTGNDYNVQDGASLQTTALYANSMVIDASGDIYATDRFGSVVRKLVLNSPSALLLTDGDQQSAAIGQKLAKVLRVQLNGRAGGPVAGATVNFAVTAGSAQLSATSTTTDPSGAAAVAVTMGSTAGPVTITATAAGTGLPAVQFTATATPPPSTCSVPQPVIGSVKTAGDFGGSPTFSSGSWIEIKGSNLAQSTRAWAGSDFSGSNAPTALDGVTVTINGKNAFPSYISPGQINVQSPADTANGPLDLTVTTGACISAVFKVQKAATAPGMLTPAAFNVGGKQYLAALFQDGVTFVGKANLITGVPFQPAAPRDSITLYGIGFGDVTPAVAPGVVAPGKNSIPNVTISFGSTAAQVGYAGLAPGAIGLYQFNVTVPDVPDGDYIVTVQAGSTPAQPQTAYLTVHR